MKRHKFYDDELIDPKSKHIKKARDEFSDDALLYENRLSDEDEEASNESEREHEEEEDLTTWNIDRECKRKSVTKEHNKEFFFLTKRRNYYDEEIIDSKSKGTAKVRDGNQHGALLYESSNLIRLSEEDEETSDESEFDHEQDDDLATRNIGCDYERKSLTKKNNKEFSISDEDEEASDESEIEREQEEDITTWNIGRERKRNSETEQHKEFYLLSKRRKLYDEELFDHKGRDGFLDDLLMYEDSNLNRISDEDEEADDESEIEHEQDDDLDTWNSDRECERKSVRTQHNIEFSLLTERSKLYDRELTDRKPKGTIKTRSGFLDDALIYENSNLSRTSDETEEASDTCEIEYGLDDDLATRDIDLEYKRKSVTKQNNNDFSGFDLSTTEVSNYENSSPIRISDEAEETSDESDIDQNNVGYQVEEVKEKPSPETQKKQREESVTQMTDGSSNVIISDQGHCQSTSEMSSFQAFSEVSNEIVRSNTINENGNQNVIQTVAANANLQLLEEKNFNMTIQGCAMVSVGNKNKVISLNGTDAQNKCCNLKKNLEGQINSMIDRIVNKNPLHRTGEDAAFARLQKYGIVIIVGPSGEGKTTMAMSMMDKIRKGDAMAMEKKIPIIAHFPDHWHQAINIDEKLVVLIENIFGDYKFCNNWIPLINIIIETAKKGNVSVIATTRTSIFLEAKPYLQHRVENRYTDFLSDKHTVDLLKQCPLTENEKKEILQRLFNEMQISPMAGEINAILKEDQNNLFGFHCIAREYLKSANDSKRDPSFFSNPKPIIVDKLKELREYNPEKYFALVVCFLWPNREIHKSLLCPGNTSAELQNHISYVADICNLETNQTLTPLRKALKSMSGSYIRDTDSAYAISQTSICEAIEIPIREEYPEIELQSVNKQNILVMTAFTCDFATEQSAEATERRC